MARGNRTRPLSDKVILSFDGEPLEAERGEPLAAALLAMGKRIIARNLH